MRVEASFSAVGLLAFLSFSDGEWGRMFDRTDVASSVDVSRCTSHAGFVEQVRTYDFFGSRAPDASQSLRQRLLVSNDHEGRSKRFTGQTDWHIEWRACFEARGFGCRIGGVVSTVNVTYTLPRWADRETAPPHLRDKWDRYIASLAAHEKGHGAISYQVAGLIDQALVGLVDTHSCDALSSVAGQVVEQVMQRGEALQRDYDRATGHGSTQGAQFPF